MAHYRYRYEIAEEVLRNGGSDEEIQQRIMGSFSGFQRKLLASHLVSK